MKIQVKETQRLRTKGKFGSIYLFTHTQRKRKRGLFGAVSWPYSIAFNITTPAARCDLSLIPCSDGSNSVLSLSDDDLDATLLRTTRYYDPIRSNRPFPSADVLQKLPEKTRLSSSLSLSHDSSPVLILPNYCEQLSWRLADWCPILRLIWSGLPDAYHLRSISWSIWLFDSVENPQQFCLFNQLDFGPKLSRGRWGRLRYYCGEG